MSVQIDLWSREECAEFLQERLKVVDGHLESLLCLMRMQGWRSQVIDEPQGYAVGFIAPAGSFFAGAFGHGTESILLAAERAACKVLREQ